MKSTENIDYQYLELVFDTSKSGAKERLNSMP
jgi:hypothetical protein